MTNFFAVLTRPFRTPDANTMAAQELADAKRLLLVAQTNRAYAESMCGFYEAQVQRLTAYIRTSTDKG